LAKVIQLTNHKTPCQKCKCKSRWWKCKHIKANDIENAKIQMQKAKGDENGKMQNTIVDSDENVWTQM